MLKAMLKYLANLLELEYKKYKRLDNKRENKLQINVKYPLKLIKKNN